MNKYSNRYNQDLYRSMQPLPGMGPGNDFLQRARQFRIDHPEVYNYMAQLAIEDAEDGGRTSAKFLVESARHKFKVSISNSLTPYFARLIAQDYPITKKAFVFQTCRADLSDINL